MLTLYYNPTTLILLLVLSVPDWDSSRNHLFHLWTSLLSEWVNNVSCVLNTETKHRGWYFTAVISFLNLEFFFLNKRLWKWQLMTLMSKWSFWWKYLIDWHVKLTKGLYNFFKMLEIFHFPQDSNRLKVTYLRSFMVRGAWNISSDYCWCFMFNIWKEGGYK